MKISAHKVALEASRRLPTSTRQLTESLVAARNRVVTHRHIIKLVHPMPKRCPLVIKNKG
jgi:hypothetical protein